MTTTDKCPPTIPASLPEPAGPVPPSDGGSADFAPGGGGRAHPLALGLWAVLRDKSIADKMLVFSACERRLGKAELSAKQEQAYNAVSFFVEEVGHVPHASEYDWWRKHTPGRDHFVSATFVRNAFGGSWLAVRALFETVHRADARVLHLTARGPAFSNEELYEVLRAWADDWMGVLGRQDLQAWLRSDRPAAVGLSRWPREVQTFRRFGSLRDALLSAGVDEPERIRRRGRPSRFSSQAEVEALREKLLDGVREWSASVQGALLRRDFVVWLSQLPPEHPLNGLRDVRDIFDSVLGSWSEALTLAGLKHRAAGARVPAIADGNSVSPRIPVRPPRANTENWEALAHWVRLAAEAGFGAQMSQPQYDGWRRRRLEEAHREGRPLEAIPCGETLRQVAGSWFTVKVRAGVPGAEQYASERSDRLSYTRDQLKSLVRAADRAHARQLRKLADADGAARNAKPLRRADYERWRDSKLAEWHAAGKDERLATAQVVLWRLGGPDRSWSAVLEAAYENDGEPPIGTDTPGEAHR